MSHFFKSFAVLALTAVTVSAFAETKSIKFLNSALGDSVKIKYKGDTLTVHAGELEFLDVDANKKFKSYCVDLDHFIHSGDIYTVMVSPTIGSSTYSVAGSVYANNQSGAVTDSAAAALQIAVWAARYGTNLVTNSGPDFKLDNTWYSSHMNIINSAIAMTNAGKSNPMDARLLESSSQDCPQGQSQLTPVPEPATMVALGTGILGLLKRRRK